MAHTAALVDVLKRELESSRDHLCPGGAQAQPERSQRQAHVFEAGIHAEAIGRDLPADQRGVFRPRPHPA